MSPLYTESLDISNDFSGHRWVRYSEGQLYSGSEGALLLAKPYFSAVHEQLRFKARLILKTKSLSVTEPTDMEARSNLERAQRNSSEAPVQYIQTSLCVGNVTSEVLYFHYVYTCF